MFAAIFALLVAAAPAAPAPPTLDQATASSVLQVAQEKYARSADRLSPGAYPELIDANGQWTTVPATNLHGWTQGFYPGILWSLAEATGDAAWRERAQAWTAPLEVQKTNRTTHDLGFKLFDSVGAAYRVTKDPHDRAVLLDAAASLASRYHAQPGVISCCDWNPAWHLPMVSDTMMNLELLFWGAANGGDPAWRDMALSHALRNAEDIVRPDGSSFHVVDYDPQSGRILTRGTYQGYADSSTWSRGHVWEMYGFTVAYRYTRDARMLAAARKTSDWYLAHLPNDLVPNWDFNAPSVHPDSSAAAAAASALLELSTYVEGSDAQRYHDAAVQMLQTLTAPPYFDVSQGSEALLARGTADLPHGKGIDTGLVYGDYYLLEALQRLKSGSVPAPAASAEDPASTSTTTSSSPSSAGCASGGASALAVLGLLAFGWRRRTSAA